MRDRRDPTDTPLLTASTRVARFAGEGWLVAETPDSKASRSAEPFSIEIYAIRFVFIFNWLASVPRRSRLRVNRTRRTAKQKVKLAERLRQNEFDTTAGREARRASLGVVGPLANKPRTAAGPPSCSARITIHAHRKANGKSPCFSACRIVEPRRAAWLTYLLTYLRVPFVPSTTRQRRRVAGVDK